jgi:hypothetical protein
MKPTTTITTSCARPLTMSPVVLPTRTAERAIGSDRKRSMIPFWMSVARPTPVNAELNITVCTKMPAMT